MDAAAAFMIDKRSFTRVRMSAPTEGGGVTVPVDGVGVDESSAPSEGGPGEGVEEGTEDVEDDEDEEEKVDARTEVSGAKAG